MNVSTNSERAIIEQRDGRIQTAADLMQLVQVIQAGVDVDPTRPGSELDPARIYYDAISAGGFYGTAFLAVEPSVGAGVLNVVGGPFLNHRRLGVNRGGSATGGERVAAILASRQPSLINTPGIRLLDGLTVSPPYFNENMPLRDGEPLTVLLAGQTTPVTISSPTYNTVDGKPDSAPLLGAMALQRFFDNWEWVSQPSNTVAFAPYLRKEPLPGVPEKSVLVQFAKGDPYMVNPATTALLRAGDLADRATFFLYDKAFPTNDTNNPPVPGYPHVFGGQILQTGLLRDVAWGAQQQAAAFFASDGGVTIRPPGVEQYFEVGLTPDSLPEGLNYRTRSLTAAPASDGLDSSPLMATSSNPIGSLLSSTTSLVDRAIDGLAPLVWLDTLRGLDDLGFGLLRPARRRR
jgi:hypothetical protein